MRGRQQDPYVLGLARDVRQLQRAVSTLLKRLDMGPPSEEVRNPQPEIWQKEPERPAQREVTFVNDQGETVTWRGDGGDALRWVAEHLVTQYPGSMGPLPEGHEPGIARLLPPDEWEVTAYPDRLWVCTHEVEFPPKEPGGEPEFRRYSVTANLPPDQYVPGRVDLKLFL